MKIVKWDQLKNRIYKVLTCKHYIHHSLILFMPLLWYLSPGGTCLDHWPSKGCPEKWGKNMYMYICVCVYICISIYISMCVSPVFRWHTRTRGQTFFDTYMIVIFKMLYCDSECYQPTRPTLTILKFLFYFTISEFCFTKSNIEGSYHK